MTRFKSTDSLGNVAYVHSTPSGQWRCTLANGTPASMSYAVGSCDVMALTFALEDAATDDERLHILKRYASNRAIARC